MTSPVTPRYAVGDRVVAMASLEEQFEGYPRWCCAKRGDVLVVREVFDRGLYRYAVSHPERTDGLTFAVEESEIGRVVTVQEEMGFEPGSYVLKTPRKKRGFFAQFIQHQRGLRIEKYQRLSAAMGPP